MCSLKLFVFFFGQPQNRMDAIFCMCVCALILKYYSGQPWSSYLNWILWRMATGFYQLRQELQCLSWSIRGQQQQQPLFQIFQILKCLKEPTCAIFLKSMGFKDIKYDIPVYQINTQIHKYKVLKRPNMCYICEKHGIQGYQIKHSRVSNVKYANKHIRKYTV